MKQYLDLLQRVVNEGVWIENKRTQTRCKTIINADLTYDVDEGKFPLLTTRKAFYRQAIGEMLGYLRGYTSTEQFHKLGVKTWDANAANPVWQKNPVCKGITDLGKIYGAAGNTVPYLEYSRTRPESGLLMVYPGAEINVLQNIIKSLKEGNDNRGLIWNFWNPGLFHLGCLRPCMYEHQFSLVGDTLYLNSTQR